MAEAYAIPIDVDAVPYRFDIELAADMFTFEVHHNSTNDYYTVNLEKGGEPVVYGAKLTYGVDLFGALSDTRLPMAKLVPRDVAGIETRVSRDNLGKTVFLYIEDEAVA